MYRSRPYGEYQILQEGDRFVARSLVDDEAEELESHSVEGLVRMIHEFDECLALSNFDDVRMPDAYRAWDAAGRQGRIKDLVRQVPHVLFAGGGTFFVEREQDNKPRVLRPESATVLNFSRSDARPSIIKTAVRSSVKNVDMTRMRAPMPESSLSRRLREKRDWARYGRIAGRTAVGMTIPVIVVATSGPIGPLALSAIMATGAIISGLETLNSRHEAKIEKVTQLAGHILAMGVGGSMIAESAATVSHATTLIMG
jgi:hypothetical protein